jgi:pantoate--beta-alanine ligase
MSYKCIEKRMLVIETIEDFKHWHDKEKGTLALVPTMGALHEGHLSLIQKAKTVADKVVLYIFVNPMQFGPKEDFGTYPRTPENDIAACEKEGVDAIFMPTLSQIYPKGKDDCTKIVPPTLLADILEGHFRPGFFTGVATVLVKFFSIVQPNAVIFGEKDYQQLLIVRRFVQDLNLPITVYGAQTVREADGLALSSRNAYLIKDQRAMAPRIHQLLQEAASKIKQAQSKNLTPFDKNLKKQISNCSIWKAKTLKTCSR